MAFLGGPSTARRDPASASPTPTYRHLLSPQAMTVFNPLRTIAHCDIDAAYAQFEQVRLGLPDDIPLICAQWQSIIAVNYPARKFGIKRFTTIDDARKMCPHLFVQHVATYREGEAEAGYWDHVDPRTHKVSLDPYRRESLKILAIFKEMAPKGEIEKASIDEAFLDLTPMVIDRLLSVHPYLSTVPSDAPDGLDSVLPRPPPIDWTKAGNVFPADGESTAEGEGEDGGDEHSDAGHSEYGSDGEMQGGVRRIGKGKEVTWEDWALCMGAEIMSDLRNEVFKKLHYTCSAGIAHNKPLAKLCSAWKKPNNQTVLRKSATPAFLRDMEFQEIRFLGGKLGRAIAEEYSAKTVGDMLTVPLDEMQARFGDESIWVYNILRGIDHTEVKEKIATKSMLASKNVRPSVTTPGQGHHWLNVLSGELHVRLREAREVSPGLWPKTLVLSTRTGGEASRSRQAAFPFTRHLSTEYIVKYARKLWDEATIPLTKGTMKLNNIALAFTGLEKLEGGQRGIEGFFAAGSGPKTEPEPVKRVRSTSPSRGSTPPIAAGAAGSTSVATSTSTGSGPVSKRAKLPTLHAGKSRPKTGLEAFLASGKGSVKMEKEERLGSVPLSVDGTETKADRKVEGGEADEEGQGVNQVGDGGWVCPKCKEVFNGSEEGGRWRSVDEQKQEHEDYHFALDLDGGGGGGSGSASGSRGQSPTLMGRGEKGVSGGKTKKNKKPEGIKAFFAPKKG